MCLTNSKSKKPPLIYVPGLNNDNFLELIFDLKNQNKENQKKFNGIIVVISFFFLFEEILHYYCRLIVPISFLLKYKKKK